MRESDNDKSSVIVKNMSAYTWYYFRRLATKPKMRLFYSLTAKKFGSAAYNGGLGVSAITHIGVQFDTYGQDTRADIFTADVDDMVARRPTHNCK